MNRRGFLAALAAAFVTDPEKLLWVPGQKLISIPAPHPYVSAAGSIAWKMDALRDCLEDLVLLQDVLWERVTRKEETSIFDIPYRHIPDPYAESYLSISRNLSLTDRRSSVSGSKRSRARS